MMEQNAKEQKHYFKEDKNDLAFKYIYYIFLHIIQYETL